MWATFDNFYQPQKCWQQMNLYTPPQFKSRVTGTPSESSFQPACFSGAMLNFGSISEQWSKPTNDIPISSPTNTTTNQGEMITGSSDWIIHTPLKSNIPKVMGLGKCISGLDFLAILGINALDFRGVTVVTISKKLPLFQPPCNSRKPAIWCVEKLASCQVNNKTRGLPTKWLNPGVVSKTWEGWWLGVTWYFSKHNNCPPEKEQWSL